MNKNLLIKIKESLSSVLPITAIVIILHFTIAPMPLGLISIFIVGAVMLILGMGLFNLGADIAMMPMGERIGAELIKSRNVTFLIIVSFIMGMIITVAEPDIKILAGQVPAVPDNVLIGSVAIGVGLFLVLAILRIVFKVKLMYMLIFSYSIVFILAFFAPKDFLTVAFDSGGVTTGPIAVPFIMALGIGVASVRGGKSSEEDNFGLVSMSLVGPIITVLIMGIFYNSTSGSYSEVVIIEIDKLRDIFIIFGNSLPGYFKIVALALVPIIVSFAIFQIIFLKLPKSQLIKMAVGVIYTFFGLVLFLTGVNIGFLPAGNYLGKAIGSLSYNWILVPIGMVMGFFIVAAEPAVPVLNKQVEEITGGAISKKAMLWSLSVGIAISVGISMVRIINGLSIWHFIFPGYAIALILSFFVSPIFTGIAFDSGAVASGPMTATFLLPFAMGSCEAIGGNILTDAFGIVSMVAMAPTITIQILGLIYSIKMKKLQNEEYLDTETNDGIIEL